VIGRCHRRALAALAGAAAAVLLLAPGAQAARPLAVGFSDDVFLSADGAERATWLDRSAQSGAGFVRLALLWSEVARQQPSGDAADPANPAYQWGAYDAAVRDADARGLQVMLTITKAPAWAEGPGRSRGAAAGTWRPNPAAFRAFAQAAAARYSGTFAGLPRVRWWQLWNEPNLSTYLTPQWTRSHGRAVAESPVTYEALVRAGAAGVRAAGRDNVVVEAGLGPYGDSPGGPRIPPIQFMRTLLCLPGAQRRRTRCGAPLPLDVVAQHLYNVGPPTRDALNPEDVAIPNIGRVKRVLATAQHLRRLTPRRGQRLWVTEMSWDSRPPDPHGYPLATQAKWLVEGFQALWAGGVDLVAWFQIRDAPPEPSYADTFQSGVYFLDGTAKPSQQAFRFPFLAQRAGRRVRVWGRAPESGRVAIERADGGSWTEVAHLSATAGAPFQATLTLPGSPTLRARSASTTSLPFAARR
jgi:Cellulase (glycosyl hydrolase family 5)